MTSVIVSDTHPSTMDQYVAQTGATPSPSGRVSAMVPMSRMRAMTIITTDKHSIAARDSFRVVDIKDKFKTRMGIVITYTIVSFGTCSIHVCQGIQTLTYS